MWGRSNKESKRPLVGLALSGGAARGIAHVGVLRALTEHRVPIDFIAGTSAGALVGGIFASGLPLAEIEIMGRTLRWRDLGRTTLSRLGVQSNERLEDFLRKRMPVTRFEDLPIPFAAVATDLHTGEAVVLSGSGDLPFALRASCAIPGWYVPVIDKSGRLLVDGGLVANLPSSIARSLGADIVIAVDVNGEGATFLGPPQSVIGVLLQSTIVMQRSASYHEWKQADIVIMPKIGHIRWDEVGRAGELIEAGEKAALEVMERIKTLLEPAAQPVKWYQTRRLRKSAPHDATPSKIISR